MHSNDAFSTTKTPTLQIDGPFQDKVSAHLCMVFGTKYAYRRYEDTQFRPHFF